MHCIEKQDLNSIKEELKLYEGHSVTLRKKYTNTSTAFVRGILHQDGKGFYIESEAEFEDGTKMHRNVDRLLAEMCDYNNEGEKLSEDAFSLREAELISHGKAEPVPA